MVSAEGKAGKSQCEIDAVHVLKRISGYTECSTVFTLLKNSLLGLTELGCYIVTAVLLYFVITMHGGIISVNEKGDGSIPAMDEIQANELVSFFFKVRVLLFLGSLITLLMALLLRKIRKKNVLLKKVNDKALDFLERHRIN